MFHAPSSGTKQQRDNSRTQSPRADFSVHAPPAYRSMGSQQQLARLHSTYGNQAILRALSRPDPAIQTKLAVNKPGDGFEQEADRVADQVMSITASDPSIQRKCSSCGEEEKVQRKCAQCEQEKKKLVQRQDANTGPATAPQIVHDVLASSGQPQRAPLHSPNGNQAVLRRLATPKTLDAESAPCGSVYAQLPPARSPVARVPPDAGHPPNVSRPSLPAPQATLTLSNHTSYNDSGGSSRKRVRFDVSIPSGENIRDYVLVNKIKGVAVRNARGDPFYVRMDEISVPFYFPDWRVDSQDHDPVFGSTGTDRWAGYSPTSTGFFYEDEPGPAHSHEPNSFYDLCFKTELHHSRNVPMEYSAALPIPLAVRYWQYYVRVDSAGRYSHLRPRGEPDRCAGT